MLKLQYLKWESKKLIKELKEQKNLIKIIKKNQTELDGNSGTLSNLALIFGRMAHFSVLKNRKAAVNSLWIRGCSLIMSAKNEGV